jgi:hypothetical protein
MRTGRLSIRRGTPLGDAAAPGPRLSIVTGAAPEIVPKTHPVSPEYQPVHDRLTALERLARLHDQAALTDAEFAAEKAMLLARHSDELVLNEPLLAPEPARGPTLVGRLLGWRFIPVGIVAGFALSFAAQPRETMRFFEEALRLFGA